MDPVLQFDSIEDTVQAFRESLAPPEVDDECG